MHFESVINVKNVDKYFNIFTRPADRLIYYLFKIIGINRVRHRQFYAIKNISFNVHRGEIFGVIGKNGSGKSTLLQLVSGIIDVSAGSIEVAGKVASILELGSGFNPEFSGRDNLYINAMLYGLSRKEIDDKYQSIVDFSGVGDFIELPIKSYSSGMIVRLAFAIIVHVNADILIIDEALAVGDIIFVEKCYKFIKDFKNKGTILLVTHDIQSVINICDRALVLDSGEILCIGTAREASDKYISVIHNSNYVADNNLSIDSIKLSDGKPSIVAAKLYVNGVEKKIFSWNEKIDLIITLKNINLISKPIIGFAIKNRFGLMIFGDNSFNISGNRINDIKNLNGVRFSFKVPRIMPGEYVLSLAISEGEHAIESHLQHYWSHETSSFNVIACETCFGVFQNEVAINFF